MKVKRFDLYEELWTKSRTAYCNEHDLEFENLKEIIKEHDIPLPTSNYLYHYRKGNILPKHPIQGDNYEIFLVQRKSEKDKLFEKWSYFDEQKKEELFTIYSSLMLPEKVGRYHKLIVKHRDYEKEEKRLKREVDRNPHRYGVYMNREKPVVLNTWHISDKTLTKYYLICDTLFKALEEAGCSITLDKERILVNIRTDQEVTNIFNKNDSGHTVYANQFTVALHFRDKNIRTKNDEGKYPSHIDEPTGYFKCEVTGRYPWTDRNYGVEKTFQGKYEADELIRLVFSRIFELAKLLHEAKIEHDKEVAERKRIEAEAEKLKKYREKEFNNIKELIHEYKVHKELAGLKEFIKATKVPKANMEEVLWYKTTLKWLDDESRMDNGLSQYQHQDLITYLLDEKTTKETEFNDNRYRW